MRCMSCWSGGLTQPAVVLSQNRSCRANTPAMARLTQLHQLRHRFSTYMNKLWPQSRLTSFFVKTNGADDSLLGSLLNAC